LLKENSYTLQKISADYIFPITSDPLKKGILILDDNGMITDIIDPANANYSLADVEYHEGFICPGFVNTHCHLELSYLKGKIKEHSGLDQFIIQLENIRKGINEEDEEEAILNAEQEMINNGIVAVGDICNNNSTFSTKNKNNIYYHSFIESFASAPEKAEKVFNKAVSLYNEIIRNEYNPNASITPHALYSLSKALFLKIKEFDEESGNIISIHHQESEEENKFFLSKDGNINDMHFRFGVEKSDFSNSGKRPLSAVADFIPKDLSLQLVHNTVTTDIDIDFSEHYFKTLYWCFCPNANLYIESKLPDFALFYNRKCRITIGTDSFASNKSLSILEELKTIHANVPFVPLHELLKWATYNGVEFLRINKNFGSLEKGKSPGLVLLENVNNDRLQIKKETTSRLLIKQKA
jgi:cytosine/adenosine deaminase-related metal-dependent hydrolase